MRTRILIASLALAVLTAGSAQAAPVIAGWDFSQWGGEYLSIDNMNLQNTLDANYSNLDPTFNLGPDSGVFGTMYFDGNFGSTLITPTGMGDEDLLPVPGSLESNLGAPVTGPGTNPFDSHNELDIEGQQFENFLSMGVFGPLSVVFEADLTSLMGPTGTGWSVSFGGKTAENLAEAMVTIEFSFDGSDYTSAGSVTLTNNDSPFSVALTSAETDRLFVRLGFGGTGVPIFDNVAVHATVLPEPATAALLLTGLFGLARMGQRRGR
jgi:hypothetical protein